MNLTHGVLLRASGRPNSGKPTSSPCVGRRKHGDKVGKAAFIFLGVL